MNLNGQVKNRFSVSDILRKLLVRLSLLEKTVSNVPAPVIPTLQEVTDEGNSSTNPILIKNELGETVAYLDDGEVRVINIGLDKDVSLGPDAIGFRHGIDSTTLVRNPASTSAVITLPSATGTLITDALANGTSYARNNNAWVALSASTPSELQKLTETTTGWRLLGKNAANYGNIGTNAVDFSESDGASATRGATASLSFACNYRTTASGNFAFASGSSTIASGFGAFATGQNGTASGDAATVTGFTCVASGAGSFATGNTNTAPSGYETVVGMYATNYSPANTSGHNVTDRVFNVGIGTVAGARADGFTVLKGGTSIFGGPARLKTYTVATLPTGVLGDTAIVTDATAPTYLGALVGGGAVVCPVFYNGTAWVSH